MSITAHCLVKNEARFVWYSVMSVIDYVDKVLLWDTGSTDGTLEIIKEIIKVGNGKISFREYGTVDANTFTKARQDMLNETTTNWFIIVDGDEIWWESSIKEVTKVINYKGKDIESIVVPTINLVGDIYHYQEESAGNYNLAGKHGHLNLRGINRRISGLHSYGPHGTWGWMDGQNKMIQDRNKEKIIFVDAPYIHATHLQRANDLILEKDVPKRTMKRKYELGVEFPRDFYYPEVFFRPKSGVIPSVWENMTDSFRTRAEFETPIRKIKRKMLSSKVGY